MRPLHALSLIVACLSCVALAEPPATRPAEAAQTGVFNATWPLAPAAQVDAEIRQYTARYGYTPDDRVNEKTNALLAAQRGNAIGDGAGQKYAVFVPNDYDPARPAGVMVFVGSGDRTRPNVEYAPVLEDANLIWIAPAGIGNEQPVPWREWVAINALREVRRRYATDPDRLYISGTSGGGRVASRLMVIASDFFTGGFPFCGVNYYADLPNGEGASWEGFWPNPDRRLLTMAKERSRIVLFTAESDMNRDETRLNFRQSQKDGFRQIAYLEEPNHGHAPPSPEYLRKGIELLDSPLVAAAAGDLARAAMLEKSRPGEALALYERGASHAALSADGKAAAADARAKAVEMRTDYAAAAAAVEAAIASGDKIAAAKSLRDLRQWSPVADADVRRLTVALREAQKRKP